MALRILLADSNIATQNMGMKILAAAGHDVVTVSNGRAAFRRITECAPEVLLLDVHLPGYDGIEICEEVKAKPDIANVSVLLTVGRMEPFSAAECVKAKADGFITKPFEAGELIAAIEKLADRGQPTVSAMPGRSGFSKLAGQPPSNETARQESNLAIETLGCVGQSPPNWQPSATSKERNAAAPVAVPACASLSQQGGEVCDVCGHVNQEQTSVCQKCDVPLPSSVMSFRRASPKHDCE